MDQKRLLDFQTQRGAKAMTFDSSVKSLESVVSDCRHVIEDKADSYRNDNAQDKKNKIKNIIINYIMDTKPLVSGYVDGESKPDLNKLINKLVEDITDYGIITNAMVDESVFEIRCNGKEIKIEKDNRVDDLRDNDGKVISFKSPEEQEIVMRKLLGDVRLTPKDALVNARTIEGYRMAAVHCSAMSPDPNNPIADNYHAFVLRKFKKSKMTLSDIVGKGTMSDNMGRTCSLSTAGGLTYFMIGPTASGKTTTANAILQSIPSSTRTVLVQNPSEIDLRFKDSTGRVYNDVLHLEGQDDTAGRSTSEASTSNIFNHTLRLSPTFIVFGELRTDEEFKLCVKIANSGHALTGTYHSGSSEDGVSRFLTAYLAVSGNQPSHLALKTITSFMNLLIVQKILRDGTRKVIQISEINGVDPNNENKPLINDLYKFIPSGKVDYDEDGRVSKIHGVHKRVGKISEKMVERLKLEGVSESRFDFLMKDVDETEVELYTGVNIEGYGMEVADVYKKA